MSQPLIAVALASGGGRTVLNLHDHISSGRLQGVALTQVHVSRRSAVAVERCTEAGLSVDVAGGNPDADASAFLARTQPDIVLLCGYLRHLELTDALQHRVLNIHPSLLPDFGGPGMYGDHVHRAVINAGASTSGCTVHLVDEKFDNGPIVLQRTCPVLDGDDAQTLAQRVFELECSALPDAVAMAVQGRLRLHDGRVDVAPEGTRWPDALFQSRQIV